MRRAIRYILITGAFALATGGPLLAADLYPAPYHPPPVAYVPAAAFCTIGPGSTSVAILERAGARVVYPILPATRLLQVVALVSWVEARSATTTNSGTALSLVSKQTSTGLAITTTPVTQPRASL